MQVFCLLLFSVLVVISAQAAETNEERLYTRACDFNNTGKYELAREALDKIIEASPQDGKALYQRGISNRRLKNSQAAVTDFTNAMRFGRGKADCLWQRARCYYSLRQYQLALEDLTGAIHLNSMNAQFYQDRGEVLIAMNEHQSALLDFDKAIRLKPSMDTAYHLRGTIYYTLGEYQLADRDLSKAISLRPAVGGYYNDRGCNNQKRNLHKEAIADFNKAQELDPSIPQISENRALSFERLGQHQKAIDGYTAALQVRQGKNCAAIYSSRGCARFRNHDVTGAIKDLNAAIKMYPRYGSAYSNLAHIFYQQGNLSEAKKYADRAIALNPGLGAPYQVRGMIFAKSGDLEQSLSDLNNSAQPIRKQTIDQAQMKETIKEYDKLMSITHEDPDLFYNRGNAYLSIGEYSKASSDLQTYLRLTHWSSCAAGNAAILASIACRKTHQKGLAESILTECTKSSKITVWPHPVVAYLGGTLSAARLTHLAGSSIDRLTLARCIIGIDLCLSGRVSEGIEELKWVKYHGNAQMDEYTLALCELNRLQGEKQNCR